MNSNPVAKTEEVKEARFSKKNIHAGQGWTLHGYINTTY